MELSLKRKVILHGYLKDLLPDVVEFAADTAHELINGLCKMTKAFDPINGRRHAVQVLGFDTDQSLLRKLRDDETEIHLVPAIYGGKKGGLFKIIIGTIIVAAALVATGGAFGGFIAAGGGLTAAGTVAFLGATLILGGLMELLSPAPKADVGDKQEGSKYLGAPGNTVKAGTRIPLIYGEHMHFGHYVSFNISTAEANPNPNTDNIDWNTYVLAGF
jgi:predicted phage tail protein